MDGADNVSTCLVKAKVKRNDTGVKVKGGEAMLPTPAAGLPSYILKSIQGLGLPCCLVSQIGPTALLSDTASERKETSTVTVGTRENNPDFPDSVNLVTR